MSSKRTAPVLVFLLAAGALSAAEPAGYKKAYFGATKPGTWARHKMTMPEVPDSFFTYTRLPDEGGEGRFQIRTDYTTGGKISSSYSDYRLKAGYSLETDALGFGKAVAGLTVRMDEGKPTETDEVALENMRKTMPDYARSAKFVGAETVDGKSCDRYAYSRRYSGRIETGELWLNETVPFGLVRQTSVTKDSSGKLLYKFETNLVDSGTGAKGLATARPSAPGPLALADAFQKEQVELTVEILAEPKDGSRVRVTFKNKGEAPLRLVIPAGATALEAGTPIDTLTLHSAAEKTLEIAPGKTSPPVDLTQSGSWRAVKGKFVISVYEGTPLFSGGVTMDHVK